MCEHLKGHLYLSDSYIATMLPSNNVFNSAHLNIDKRYSDEGFTIFINYCPICGKPLNVRTEKDD